MKSVSYVFSSHFYCLLKLSLLLGLVLMYPLSGAWSGRALQIFAKNIEVPFEYKDADFMSYYGGILRTLEFPTLTSKEDVEYSTSGLTAGKLPVYKSFRESTQAKPLIVFIPGVSAHFRGQITPIMIERFEQADYHVVSVLNPLHKEFIKSRPKYNQENYLYLDAQIILELIVQAIADKKNKISSIHVMGESLGAFLASQLALFESQKRYDFFFSYLSSLTLLWPPLELNYSLRRFEWKFSQALKEKDRCSYLYTYSAFLWYGLILGEPQNLREIFQICLGRYMFTDAFSKSVESAAHELNDESLMNANFKKSSEITNYTQLTKAHNPYLYKDLMRTFTDNIVVPEFLLGHHLKKWRKRGISLKIVSSKDDFINQSEKWLELSEHLEPRSIHLFPWGGHCAPLAYDFWKEVIREEYK